MLLSCKSTVGKNVQLILFLFLFFGPAGIIGCSGQSTQQAISTSNSDDSSVIRCSDIQPHSQRAASNLSTKTVSEIMNQMTLREKIGQLFFVRSYGYFMSEDDDDYQKLVHQIKDLNVGGVTFFAGTVCGQAMLANKYQSLSEIPLWISEDMEFGAAMRVEDATRITPAMGIAATGNPNFAYWAGKITAQEAKALGVHQMFAPVLDVNNNPHNPVINTRSFSGNPQTVATFATRFIDGAASEGILTTGKHFPGHGDTDTDSHYALPVVYNDYARLDSVELVPFRAAIEAGIPSIMSAHIVYPEISRYENRPSTLDPSILGRILRDSLGFDGLVVTDGLEMSGIASYYSPGEAVVLALKAGADIMLLSPDVERAINEVVEAVEDGRISEARINQSVRKLLVLKKKKKLFIDPFVSIQHLSEVIHSKRNQLMVDKIARKSLVLLKNEQHIIPIRTRRFSNILVLGIAENYSGETGSLLAEEIRKYHPGDVRFEAFDRRTNAMEANDILKDADWADLIIMGSFININPSDDDQYSNRQRNFIEQLPEDTPSVLVTFGNPYAVQDMPDAEVHLLAWDDADNQIKNTVPGLFGWSPITGTLPIKIPEMYQRGDGLKQTLATHSFAAPELAGLSPEGLQEVGKIMHNAVEHQTFPGGVVAVVKDGILAYCRGFGYYTYEKQKAVTPYTVYDMASVTKVVATTTSIMKLVSEGRIDINDHVSEYFPEYATGAKSEITLRNFLLHNSGLPPFRIYIDSLQTREAIIEAVKSEPLVYETGTKYVYSDLGFILLGRIVEKVTGMRLDEYVRKTFYEPLGMTSTYFNPKHVGPWLVKRIPPAEIDTVYRHKTIQAEAHDERAWYMDGVAGHAGLFSSAQDLVIWAQMLLNKGSYAGKQYIDPEVVEIFTSRQSDLNNRSYGFDRKSLEGFTSAGDLASDQTFGHTGFTGSSIWIDPTKDMAVIVLTNRAYPYRSYGHNLGTIRAKVADAVFSSIVEE